jgi:hypothetical protein
MAQISITETRTKPNAGTQIGQGNVFANCGSGGQGNLFSAGAGRTQTCTPPTQECCDVLRARISTLPHHPDTAAGWTAYIAQLEAWKTQYSADQRITEYMPFPLKPGTSMICSGECYNCGQVNTGHNANTCMNTALSLKERAWRAICGSTLGPINQPWPTPVNIIQSNSSSNELAWMDTVGVNTFGEQGNGEGPSA